MTERRTVLTFKVLLFMLRHAISKSSLTRETQRERVELEGELEKEIRTILGKCEPCRSVNSL